MVPVSPVVKGHEGREIKIKGKGYAELPALVIDPEDGTVLSRWRPSDKERQLISAGADVMLYVKTFGQKLQPVLIQADESAVVTSGDGGKGEKTEATEANLTGGGLIQ